MTNQSKNSSGFLTLQKSFAKKKQSIMLSWTAFRYLMAKIKRGAKEAFLLFCLMLWGLVSILILVTTFWIITLIGMISIIASRKESPSILSISTRSLKEDCRKRPLTLLLQVLASASLCLCAMWLLVAWFKTTMFYTLL
jgi:hypothetical protein